MTIKVSRGSILSDLIKNLTVAHHARIAVLNHAEEGRPLGEVIEVETKVVILSKGIKVGRIELEQVQWGHAPD